VNIHWLVDKEMQPMHEHPNIVAVFAVGAMIGNVPAELWVEHVVHLAVGDFSTTRLRPGTPAPVGAKYIEVIKASSRDTNRPVSLAFDQNGPQVDGVACAEICWSRSGRVRLSAA